MIVTSTILLKKFSNTEVYESNGITLKIDKSNFLSNSINPLRYIVERIPNGFKIRFYINKNKLKLERIAKNKIRVRYGNRNNFGVDLYIDIYTVGHIIQKYKLEEYFLLMNSSVSCALKIHIL